MADEQAPTLIEERRAMRDRDPQPDERVNALNAAPNHVLGAAVWNAEGEGARSSNLRAVQIHSFARAPDEPRRRRRHSDQPR